MRKLRAPRFAAARMFGHTGNEGNRGDAACTLRETTDAFCAGVGAPRPADRRGRAPAPSYAKPS